ncbi:heparinase [Planomonospora sphaerica]|uniref:Heparinase n=1 Tax=Planomonospora sphaerica TaxID=161355 RepID=A0A171DMZ4_9ACTN|nr:heparinase II/III family protein [Planomonospora sphaerica]GAT70419.1 heparinase [Planomonospora sphaerica]
MFKHVITVPGPAVYRPAVPVRLRRAGAALLRAFPRAFLRAFPRASGQRSALPSLRAGEGPAVCVPGGFPAIDAAEVLRGRVVFAGLPPVDLGTGGIDWLADPHRSRSWALNLHALRWMGGLVVEYERSGNREFLDRAAAIAEDWVRGNPQGGAGVSPWAWAEHPVALRGPALVCLSAHVRAGWLRRSLAEHGRVLADPALYRRGHNHGLDQDIALLTVGRRLGHRPWQELAVRRMTGSALLAIDGQGALHEQAPRYGLYVHRRLGVALETITRCGMEVPPALAARRAALESYVAHATQPDGSLVPIGDGPAGVRPVGFPARRETVRVFDAGYVFARTAWDDPASAYYSIRFGPGRRLHGHEDHLGVTYHAQGRAVLVEAGFHSYERTPYQRWTASPEAHNVPVVPGATFREGTATHLVSASTGPERQCFRLTDDAYGVRRTRSVLVVHGADLMAVLDEVPAGSALRSLWHFDPSLTVVSVRDGRVVLADGERRVTLVQLSPASGLPLGGQEVEHREIATGHLRTARSATVLSPAARSVLTLIVPGTGDPEVTCAGGRAAVRTPGGPVSFPLSLDR